MLEYDGGGGANLDGHQGLHVLIIFGGGRDLVIVHDEGDLKSLVLVNDNMGE